MTLAYTLYRSLYDLSPVVPVHQSWPELASAFTKHARFGSKFDAPGFGPYELEAPAHRCKHPNLPGPHRCDACVWALTLAVFDADQGGHPELIACRRELDARGLSYLLYSSYSFQSLKAARIPLRLVIPLAVPFDARRWSWPHFRSDLIRKLKIPADPGQCGGRSHFYFLPAASPGAEVWADHQDGQFLHPADYATPLAFRPRTAVDWAPPPPPTETVELGPLLERLRARARTLRRGTARDQRKAKWLDLVLDGKPLANHGERNSAMFTTAKVMAFALPEQPVEVLAHLLRPSLEGMVVAGSKLTSERVEEMLLEGLEDAAARRREREMAEARANAVGQLVQDFRGALRIQRKEAA